MGKVCQPPGYEVVEKGGTILACLQPKQAPREQYSALKTFLTPIDYEITHTLCMRMVLSSQFTSMIYCYVLGPDIEAVQKAQESTEFSLPHERSGACRLVPRRANY